MIKNLSFWEQEFMTQNLDFTIIGAGIVGLSTAYFLKNKFPTSKIVVLERQFPGSGASTKNAGFACIGSPTEILSDLEDIGERATIDLIKMRWNGLKLLKEIISPDLMDFRNLGSKELFINQELKNRAAQKLEYLNQIMEEATLQQNVFSLVKNTETRGLEDVAIQCDIESQLNPMLMMYELYRKVLEMGVQVIYGMDVKKIIPESGIAIVADDVEIRSAQLIVCTNGMARDLININDLKAVRNQVLMTKPLRSLPISGNYHVDRGYIYFRSYGDRLLIGGARNIDADTETCSTFGDNQKIINYLKTFVQYHIYQADDLEYEKQWSGILGVGSSKQPIISAISDRTTLAVRLGGMGVAIGTGVGNKVADMITA